MVERYILDGTICTFHDDGLGLVFDFRDVEGAEKDRSELSFLILVAFPVYVEVDLISVVDLLVVSAKKFVKFALVP